MRCAEAERNRDHVSFRQFQVNASLSFYEGYKRDPVAVQSDALAHHTGGNAFDDYARESVKISRWAIGSANRNAFWAQAQDDGRAGLDLSRDFHPDLFDPNAGQAARAVLDHTG